MRLWKRYHTPATVDEALSLLAQYAGQAHVVAGGTDLLVDMRAESAPEPHEALVDVSHIAEMRQIRAEDGAICVGASVTHTQIVESALLAHEATCLVEGCGVIGGPQVRNVGTLGGNVAHALPAADGTTALVALDAEAEIVQGGARQWVPMAALFAGAGQSALDHGRDLIIRFRFARANPGEASAFKRVMRPQGVALPILGCAVWLRLDSAREVIEAARVTLAPVAPVPQRIPAVEAALTGQPATADTVGAALRAADGLRLRTSKYRATAEYRREMAAVLLRRALTAAIQRARTGQVTPEHAEK
ncbi:MAG: xanthine dehydrogenase family protein subunit M [Anaerolineae bacterium]|nr:xanthine dehydrogenase family protein subunit M [Anaerolineae bacterium]